MINMLYSFEVGRHRVVASVFTGVAVDLGVRGST